MGRHRSRSAPLSNLARTRIIPLSTTVDPRGVLTAAEGNDQVPFTIRRIFYVYRVQPPYERGGHAHPHTEQFLIAVAGSLRLDVRDPFETRTFLLDDPSYGLYVPPMLWVRLYDFTPDAVCLAAASTHYAPGEVVRDWDEYVRRATAGDAGSGSSADQRSPLAEGQPMRVPAGRAGQGR